MLSQILSDRAVVQAPMAGVQDTELTIAVCEAGGIGSLPCAMLSAEVLRASLAKIQAATDAPFMLNFFCHTPVPCDPAEQQRWRSALDSYYTEWQVEGEAASAFGREPFNQNMLALVSEYKPPIVSFHFGLPSQQLLDGVRATGAQVLGCATTLEEALWLQARGVDGVIAQGIEAGGHQGRFLANENPGGLPCLALVATLLQNLSLPVIAAGGIANRGDAEAALAAGASAVQVGSAYLQADEATTSAVHLAALQSEAAKHTALTNVFSGRRARSIVNRLVREQGPISEHSPSFPHAAQSLGPLRSAAEATGSGDFSPLWSGRRGYLGQALPAAEITRNIDPRQG